MGRQQAKICKNSRKTRTKGMPGWEQSSDFGCLCCRRLPGLRSTKGSDGPAGRSGKSMKHQSITSQPVGSRVGGG